jgi:hypothetical protein
VAPRMLIGDDAAQGRAECLTGRLLGSACPLPNAIRSVRATDATALVSSDAARGISGSGEVGDGKWGRW